MRSIAINKKGQTGIAALPSSVIGLGIAGISLVLMLVVLSEMVDVDTVKKTLSSSIVNETITPSDTGTALACASYPGASTFSISAAYNDTSAGTLIAAGNYSVTSAGLLKNLTSEFTTNPWNVTYTCRYGDEAYISGNASIYGIGTFADFWVIIVLAIVAAVVIGIIFGAFGKVNR